VIFRKLPQERQKKGKEKNRYTRKGGGSEKVLGRQEVLFLALARREFPEERQQT